jgi:hypothetical protein
MSNSNEVHQYCFLVRDYCGTKGWLRCRSQVERLREDVEAFAGFVYSSGAEVLVDFSGVQLEPGVRLLLRRWFAAPEFHMLRILPKAYRRAERMF